MRRAISRRVSVGERLAAEQDLAALGRQHPAQQPEQRRLAAAVRPEQADDCAVAQRHRDVAENRPLAARVGEREAAGFDHGSTATSSAQQPERSTWPSLRHRSGDAEERAVRHERVVLAAFAAGIDAEAPELRRTVPAAETRPSHDSSRNSARAVTITASLPDETHSSNRTSVDSAPQRLDGGQAGGRADALGPRPMLLEQDVAEDHMRDPARRQPARARRRTPRRSRPAARGR